MWSSSCREKLSDASDSSSLTRSRSVLRNSQEKAEATHQIFRFFRLRPARSVASRRYGFISFDEKLRNTMPMWQRCTSATYIVVIIIVFNVRQT